MVPIITISLYHLCRGLLKPTHTRKKEKANSWIEVQQSFVDFSSFVCRRQLGFLEGFHCRLQKLKKRLSMFILLLPVRFLTTRSLQCSLAATKIIDRWMRLKAYLIWMLFQDMRSILACHPWWEGRISISLMMSS